MTDLPVGVDPEREQWLGSGPLAFVRLVAPTTPDDRMHEIGEHGSGFVYLISRLGVTGARDDVPDELPDTIGRLRRAALPICVGFGISNAAQARRIGARRWHRRRERHRPGGGESVAAAARPGVGPQGSAGRGMIPRAPAGLWARLLAMPGRLSSSPERPATRWVDHPWALAIMAVTAAIFRMRAVSITKFASLNVVQIVAMTGALAAGVTTTAIAIYAGVLLADVLHHRKPFTAAAWINASREMVTLFAAYGIYAAVAIRIPEATAGMLVPESIPAIAVFFLSHFMMNRAALYATLISRASSCLTSRR